MLKRPKWSTVRCYEFQEQWWREGDWNPSSQTAATPMGPVCLPYSDPRFTPRARQKEGDTHHHDPCSAPLLQMSLLFSVLIQSFLSLKVHIDESLEEGSWLPEVFLLLRIPTGLTATGCATLPCVTRQCRPSPDCIGLGSQTEGSLTSRTSFVTSFRAFTVALLCSRSGTLGGKLKQLG